MTTAEDQEARQDVAKDDIDIEGTVMKILNKQQPDEAVGMLLKDNYKQRERMRRLSDERDQLKSEKEALENQETDDNTEELAKLAKWQELGDFNDVKSNLDRLTDMEYTNQIRQVAQVAEMDWEVLKDLDKLNTGIVLSIQDDKAVVKQDDTVVPLDEYAKAEWPAYLPSLRKTKGTSYIQQTSSKAASSGTNLVDSFIQGKKEKAKISRLKSPNPEV